ncbi:hypothetical protein CC1G_15449 [Coprinopsis cinerea okayama7|uniref:Uncharacterized protein n=1 Tax=Coprinopsis cinerea (strain Okayama-7 / 130 / ATCC MYA-4618 / FGSC 9003) TaxID=240176 RepID=D6RQV1_COPC7|nr:hypothetical protein CC1G_15449 [Coprinopsis cinerea okayama7\|eukprot:XP_002910172.1 hypothetical protein CC1G_15449 [Coprinopsis cinerea okayama7\
MTNQPISHHRTSHTLIPLYFEFSLLESHAFALCIPPHYHEFVLWSHLHWAFILEISYTVRIWFGFELACQCVAIVCTCTVYRSSTSSGIWIDD